jgi:hypothetical protein
MLNHNFKPESGSVLQQYTIIYTENKKKNSHCAISLEVADSRPNEVNELFKFT